MERAKTYALASLSCAVLIAYSLVTIIVMVLLGPAPSTPLECYSMIADSRFLGLLRLDILTVFAMPLYYVLFFGIYAALIDDDRGLAAISTLLVFAGLTLFLATPSVFSYLHLADRYRLATSDDQRNNILAAGEAIIASDMWHGTGPRIGGILMQIGGLMISFAMLKGNTFGKPTAYVGVATHGLDLAHLILGFFLPVGGAMLMAIAGPLYLLWFPLLGIRFLRMSKDCRKTKG
jgi:hypothetical protein